MSSEDVILRAHFDKPSFFIAAFFFFKFGSFISLLCAGISIFHVEEVGHATSSPNGKLQ